MRCFSRALQKALESLHLGGRILIILNLPFKLGRALKETIEEKKPSSPPQHPTQTLAFSLKPQKWFQWAGTQGIYLLLSPPSLLLASRLLSLHIMFPAPQREGAACWAPRHHSPSCWILPTLSALQKSEQSWGQRRYKQAQNVLQGMQNISLYSLSSSSKSSGVVFSVGSFFNFAK